MQIELKKKLTVALKESLSYKDYLQLATVLAQEGGTTGSNSSEAYVQYTRLNTRRMKRWDKTLKISETYVDQIKAMGKSILWLVFTESWCGDAAPSLPVMAKMAQINPNIALKIVLRDAHLDLMDHFLTNGARSIPKLVQLEPKTLHVTGTWGPRPVPASQMAADYKEDHGKLTPAFREELQKWYNKDRGNAILKELLLLLALE